MKVVAGIAAVGLLALGLGLSDIKDSKEQDAHYKQLERNYERLEANTQPLPPQAETQPQVHTVPADSYVEPGSAEIEWYGWADGERVAKQTGKPAYVHFTKAQGCAPCEVLRKQVYPSQDVVAASRQFVCIEIYLAATPEQETKEGNAAVKAFGLDRRNAFPQDVFVAPGWGKVYKVLPNGIPHEPARFTQYLDAWFKYLTTVKNKG
jgi:thioredoxin-related protein